MGNKEQTYTIKIDAELSSLQDKITKARESLDSFLQSGKAPKGLTSAFEKLEGLLGRISDKTKQVPSKSLFSGVEKDLSNAELLFGEIIRGLGALKNASKDVKLELFPPEERAKLDAAIVGLKKYQELLESIKEKEAKVEAARKTSEKADKNASSAKQVKSDIKRKKDKAETRKEGLQGQVAALEVDPEKNAVRIAKLRGEISELDLEIKNLTTDYNAASRALTEANKVAAEAKNNYEGLSAELGELELTGLGELSKQAKEAGLSIESIEGESPRKAIDRLNGSMESFIDDSLEKLPKGANDAKEAMEDYSEAISSATEKTRIGKQANDEFEESLAQKSAFENKIKQFLGFAGAAHTLRSALRNAMQTITELDATMTEMAVVTDLTVGDYWDQLPEYAAQASSLGVSINDAYKAATLYYQQGLKGNEVTKISAETLKMAAIAGLSAEDATNKMTAALRGFNMELNEASAQRIADVYSELAAITAADVDEISNAMTKTASIASSAGMEFETTAAFLSQIIETTRESAETAGTALKTVIARFQELKKDPSEIGEVDGEIVDANAIETALRSVGVSLRDTSGQFRELDDVFLELSSKWDGLDKNTQRYIATIAAGSRQQSRFIAMMSDYARTQELVTAANTSAGASQRQFEKTLESLQAKLAKLKNAWDEFTMGIMDSELVKFGVDVLTKFLEIVNKATSGIEGLGGSLVKILSVVGIFKMGQKIFQKFKEPVIEFFADIVKRASLAGHEAAKEFTKSAQEESNEPQENQPQPKPQTDEPDSEKKKGSLKEKILDMTGITGLKDIKDSIGKAISGRRKKKADKNLDEADARFQETQENIGSEYEETLEAAGNLQEAIQEATAAEVDFNRRMADGRGAADQLMDGFSKTGAAALGMGAGLSAAGAALSSMGLEGAGEFITSLGNGLMLVGTALTALPPIIKVIGAVGTAVGIKTSLAWIWVTVIAAAIAAIIVGIVALAKHMKSQSLEAQLERAREAAEGAGKAADEAKNSYQELGKSIDGLKNKYKALEGLTKGTKEWKEQVLETNQEVLDLIDKYPEMAKLVQNEGGVLTIDMESDAVENILQGAYEQVLATSNIKSIKDMKVTELERKVEAKDLKKDVDFTYGYQMVTNNQGYNVLEAQKLSQDQTDALAKAFAEGTLIKQDGAIKYTGENEAAWLDSLGLSAEEFDMLSDNIYDNVSAIRSYGDTLREEELITKSTYDTMATSIVALTDTIGKSQEEIDQMFNIVDGDDYQQAYDDVIDKIGGSKVDLIDDSGYQTDIKDLADGKLKGMMTEKDIDAAFEAAGYKNYKLDQENGKITYDDAEGKQTTKDISEADIEDILANYYATTVVKRRAEYADDYVKAMTNNLGNNGEGDATLSALQKALQSESGDFLNLDEVKELANLTKEEMETAFGQLPKYLQDIYGTVDNLYEEMDNAKNTAARVLDETKAQINEQVYKAGAGLFDSLSAGALKGLADKTKDIDTDAATAIAGNMAGLVEDLDEKTKDEIARRISQADWSDLDSLNVLTYDLQYQYGLEAEAANDLVESIKSATGATSKYLLEVDKFGDLYKSQKALAAATEELTKLQWEYEQALRDSSTTIGTTIDNMLSNYGEQGAANKASFDAARTNIQKIYAQGVGPAGANRFGMDLSDLVDLNTDGTVSIKDQAAIDSYIADGKLNGEEFNKWLEELEEQRQVLVDSEEGIRDQIDAVQDLQDQLKESYSDLRDRTIEAYTSHWQKQIDIQQETLDATRDAASEVTNKLQEQINTQRQARENEKTEQSITDKQQQLAYLQMSSAGGGTAAMELQKQIEEEQQAYEDTLIDQSIQSLQDANEKAAEQRERQIALQQAQLDAYLASSDFQNYVTDKLDEMLDSESPLNSTLGQLLTEIETVGMTDDQRAEWEESFSTSVANAVASRDKKFESTLTTLNGLLDKINNTLSGKTEDGKGSAPNYQKSSEEKAWENTKSTLQKAGFGGAEDWVSVAASTGGNEADKVAAEDKISNALKIQESDSNNYTGIKDSKTRLDAVGFGYQDQRTYYGSLDENKVQKGTAQTYQQYLEEQVRTAKLEEIDKINQMGTYVDEDAFKTARQNYVELGGDEQDFLDAIGSKKIVKKIDVEWNTDANSADEMNFWDLMGQNRDGSAKKGGAEREEGNFKYGETTYNFKFTPPNGFNFGDGKIPTAAKGEEGEATTSLGTLALVQDTANPNTLSTIAALLPNGKWAVATDSDDYGRTKLHKKIFGYETGGLADFTGPAWLDGTPTKPEYILNADQTERFFSLIDVLESYNKNGDIQGKTGDNYFDIEINVEKLESDYDVEQVANKIRRMIYDDASYRNVNAINLIR